MKRLTVTFLFALILGTGLASAQQWSVSTNLADYAILGTLNAGASYSPLRHVSVDAGVKYNPFTFHGKQGQFQLRQQTWWAGMRWWPWHNYSGWWVAGRMQYREYNYGGIISQKTEEGDMFGLGASAGYSYLIAPHLNLEFGLGLWGGYKMYTVYACPKCGRTTERGGKGFVMPNDLVLALCYVF